jgi:hypothetical protein
MPILNVDVKNLGVVGELRKTELQKLKSIRTPKVKSIRTLKVQSEFRKSATKVKNYLMAFFPIRIG